jgi:hypothetical protein
MRMLHITQAVLLIICVLIYGGLTLYSLHNWHEAVSAGLCTGFALMVQDVVRGFFRWLQGQDANADGRKDNQDATK